MNGGGNWRELRTDPHNAALLLSLPPGPITAGPALSLPAEGVAFQRNHRYDEAAAVFAATLAGRFDPAVSAALAHCLLFGGKFARAHAVLRQMVYAFPRNGRAFRMLAALFKQVGNPALTKQYEQISRQFPREADESAELAGEETPRARFPPSASFWRQVHIRGKAIFGSFSAITKWAIGWKW